MYEQELQNLGLSEKEAKVYTASLQLGPETAQNIAKHSKVNRATAYVQIDSLKEKGLMSEFSKGKKTFFTAEDPEILSRLMDKEQVELNFRKQKLDDLLPELSKYYVNISAEQERPSIRFFEGSDGIAQIRKDFLRTKNQTIYGFMDFDQVMHKLVKNQEDYTAERVKRKIQSRILYTRSKGEQELDNDPKKLRKLKFVKKTEMPFESDITIYQNKVAIISYKSEAVGVIIENKAFAMTMKTIFNLLWDKI
ncbi:MAG: helix-turn-helix domain-containing protein [Candidatus Doudnabacteria bacterium]